MKGGRLGILLVVLYGCATTPDTPLPEVLLVHGTVDSVRQMEPWDENEAMARAIFDAGPDDIVTGGVYEVRLRRVRSEVDGVPIAYRPRRVVITAHALRRDAYGGERLCFVVRPTNIVTIGDTPLPFAGYRADRKHPLCAGETSLTDWLED